MEPTHGRIGDVPSFRLSGGPLGRAAFPTSQGCFMARTLSMSSRV